MILKTERGTKRSTVTLEGLPTSMIPKVFMILAFALLGTSSSVSATEAPVLVGPVWEWVYTIYEDGRKVVPPEPGKYTVQFLKAGTVKVKADCNVKGGTYSLTENRLSTEISHSTMAACQEGSLEDQFVHDLVAGADYFLKGGNLTINLKYDSGRMHFFTGGTNDKQ
jgi:heat shock protein HslJ